MISKSLSTSEKYAALSGPLTEFCHALYPLLIPHTDDFGRLQGDPFTVKHACYPASGRSLEEFAAGLRALHDVELIIWYQVSGKRFVQITQFEPHQQGLHKRTRSQFPRVPGSSGNIPDIPSEEKGTEEKRTKEKGKELSSADADFEVFRLAYPPSRRVGGRLVRSAFERATCRQTVPSMLTALEQHKRSEQWQTPKLIPLMTTWLNQERWLQVLPEPAEPNRRGSTCHHEPQCRTQGECTKKIIADGRRERGEVAS